MFQELKRKKTSIVKKDDSPQFQESFNFRVEEDEFEQAGLRVTCMQQLPLLEKGDKKSLANTQRGGGDRGENPPPLTARKNLPSPWPQLRGDSGGTEGENGGGRPPRRKFT